MLNYAGKKVFSGQKILALIFFCDSRFVSTKIKAVGCVDVKARSYMEGVTRDKGTHQWRNGLQQGTETAMG